MASGSGFPSGYDCSRIGEGGQHVGKDCGKEDYERNGVVHLMTCHLSTVTMQEASVQRSHASH
jgi:hypothetical protein